METALIVLIVVIGLPWLVMHYLTRWKTAPHLTEDDETMLEDLYQLARRLDERMETVERLTENANTGFTRPRLVADHEADKERLAELDRMMKEKTR